MNCLNLLNSSRNTSSMLKIVLTTKISAIKVVSWIIITIAIAIAIELEIKIQSMNRSI